MKETNVGAASARRGSGFDPLLWLLNGLQIVAAPFLLWKKWRRFRARREVSEWDLARWKCSFPAVSTPPVQPRPTSKHLVFVIAGFAEARLAVQLGQRFIERCPNWRFSLAVQFMDAARQGEALPPGCEVANFPFDFWVPVRNWRRRVAPDAVVFVEKFWFANFVRGLCNGGVPLAAIAARSRDHRGGRYRIGAFYSRWLLRAFNLICLRSNEELLKLGPLLSGLDARVVGSLKFWPVLPEISPARAEELKNWLAGAGNRPVLAAGSTQPGDEAWIFEAFAPLGEELGAVLLLAPRHQARCDEVETLIRARGWKVTRRSDFTSLALSPDKKAQVTRAGAAQQSPTEAPPVEVFLLDTLGELTHAYGAAQAAFVGGTLAGTGHNILEPIAHGIPVFYGFKRGTFAAEQEMCEAAGVGFRVETPAQLTQGWREMLLDRNRRAVIADKARLLNETGARAWHDTVMALVEFAENHEKSL